MSDDAEGCNREAERPAEPKRRVRVVRGWLMFEESSRTLSGRAIAYCSWCHRFHSFWDGCKEPHRDV